MRVSTRTVIGLILTVAYLGLMWSSLGGDFLAKWKTLELNAKGDFLAGAFAPLAFLWLVLGYFQQGEELRHQIEELKQSVKHQGDLAEVTRKEHESNKLIIELQQEALLADRAQRRAAAEPRISVTMHPHSAFWQMQILNDGKHVLRQVRIVGLPGELFQHGPRVADILPPGHVHSALLANDWQSSLGLTGPLPFSITADADGGSIAAAFQLILVHRKPHVLREEQGVPDLGEA